jgi:hypothetical protein
LCPQGMMSGRGVRLQSVGGESSSGRG